MGLLLGFVPFIIFTLLASLSVSLGLWLAFAVAFVITIRDFVESPSLRALDAASVTLFAALAFFVGFVEPSLSLPAVRLAVEACFFVLALGSILLRRPLTLPYGHASSFGGMRETAAFRRTNYALTAAWALAFAAMALADAATSIADRLSLMLDLAIGLAALGLVITFTARYPLRLRAEADPVFRRF